MQPSLFGFYGVPAVRADTKQSFVAKERDRLNAAAERVLERLKTGPATNVELCAPSIGGLRAVGRIHELRERGYQIGKEHVSGGIWLYRLVR